jgi:glycolate oxidase FAD binding subunit
MQILKPQAATELAAALAECASTGRHIRVFGSSSKDRMGGPLADADVGICTSAMKRLIQYEPRDLTISVEAGMPFAELSRLLAENRQMIPIDPPYFDTATVGGIVAASTSGPRRRLYGSVRDLIIGMTFATLEGKLVNSGGMVVKNVAGLDMGKLMAGSFGTLAVLGVVNFKLLPIPEVSRTFIMRFATIDEAITRRDEILKGVLLPAALDLLNPAGAKRVGLEGYCLVFQAGGNTAVMDRYVRELPGSEVLEGAAETSLWESIREFTPRFLAEHAEGAVVRVSSTLMELKQVLSEFEVPVVARAANAISYACFADASLAKGKTGKWIIESAPVSRKPSLDLWPAPGNDFDMMKKVKQMFDPQHLLNEGRLYGRI